MSEGARRICTDLLSEAGVPIGSTEPHAVHVNDERLWSRVVAQRQLGLGESYMDGWWDCNRLDEMLTRVIAIDAAQRIPLRPRILWHAALSTAVNHQTQRRAARNARHHYDIGNDLYTKMLDKRMIYSCGYWQHASDLDSAQEAKLDLICRKLELEPGMRVLDIGCGWGGFLQFAAERYGIIGTGISPATQQVSRARERCAGLSVTIQQMEYRDLRGTFDRIVSVGMLEHVGPRNLRTFFATCDRILAEDGLMLHHTIGSTVSKQHSDPFFDRYIFPGGVLPSLAQFTRSAEPTWVIEDVHNFGPDYDRTLMSWSSNIESRWTEIPQYDERFRRMWRFYLLGSAAGFRARSLQLWQVVMRRKGRTRRYASVR
nr:cyclopropane fatty acyl phospholipid synthase [Acidobacteriota bacterium]